MEESPHTNCANPKSSVLWIGSDPNCSVRDGLAWHTRIEGMTLLELISLSAQLEKGRSQEWCVGDQSLVLRGAPLPYEFLDSCVAAVINHKSMAMEEIARVAEIESWIGRNLPNVRIENPTSARLLFASKLGFMDHASLMPRARMLIPEYRHLHTAEDLEDAIVELGLPLVLKPDDQSGGVGVTLVTTARQARQVYQGMRRGKYYNGLKGAIIQTRSLLDGSAKGPADRKESTQVASNHVRSALATRFIDTYQESIRANLNCVVYFWGSEIFFVAPRISRSARIIGWHSNEYVEALGVSRFRMACELTFAAIERHRPALAELRTRLPAWCVRLDCLIKANGDLYVAEPELKWGLDRVFGSKVLQAMKAAGYSLSQVREALGVAPVDVRALTRAVSATRCAS